MRKLLNIYISFPVISILDETDVKVFQEIKSFTICKKSYIKTLIGLKEIIIDSNGILYKRISLYPSKYINVFHGFSIKFGGFGVCYIKINLEKKDVLLTAELKHYGLKIFNLNKNNFVNSALPVNKLINQFEQLVDREDILRYIFYFAETSYYLDPDNNDTQWRKKIGFR